VNRAAAWLLTAGVLLFVGLLASQGIPLILTTLAGAGWGLLLLAVFHVLPLALDAAAIRVLFQPGMARPLRAALLARWVGESANSLMPAGQLGGPVIMARHLARQGMSLEHAAAAITVSTTLQTFAQIGFALMGVALVGVRATHGGATALRSSALIASLLLALQVGGFYWLQRRGLFGRLMRTASRFSGKFSGGKRDWSRWVTQAQAIDLAVQSIYARSAPAAASFGLSLAGWLIGTGEVWLVMPWLGHPVDWTDALLLESLGSAIRGAAFAIPGALGVQEGGYWLLAPLVGIPPPVALALSLAKRARELLLGLPGLLYWLVENRVWRRRRLPCDNAP
jgi:putative membrane protein